MSRARTKKPHPRSQPRSYDDALQFLSHNLGRSSKSILAHALRRGLSDLYRSAVLGHYRAGEITRSEAVSLLDERLVSKSEPTTRKPSARRRS